MQAILCKVMSPTDTTGTSILATCYGGRLRQGLDYELSTEENALAAAKALAAELGWPTEGIVIGQLPDGNYAAICTTK